MNDDDDTQVEGGGGEGSMGLGGGGVGGGGVGGGGDGGNGAGMLIIRIVLGCVAGIVAVLFGWFGGHLLGFWGWPFASSPQPQANQGYTALRNQTADVDG